jgi:hypothetical protein
MVVVVVVVIVDDVVDTPPESYPPPLLLLSLSDEYDFCFSHSKCLRNFIQCLKLTDLIFPVSVDGSSSIGIPANVKSLERYRERKIEEEENEHKQYVSICICGQSIYCCI